MHASRRSRVKYPLATISAYGPDNRRATKLVVGVLLRAGQKLANPMRSWSTDTGDVRNDPAIAVELADWLRNQGIKDTLRLSNGPYLSAVPLLGRYRSLHA
jgi:hypothetical protein